MAERRGWKPGGTPAYPLWRAATVERMAGSPDLAAFRVRRPGQAPLKLDRRRFGSLVVLGQAEGRAWQYLVWRCRCDCGAELVVRGTLLARGKKYRCGRRCPRRHSPAARRRKEAATGGTARKVPKRGQKA